MNKNEALTIVDKICQFVPLTHSQHELLAQSLHALATGEGDAKEAASIVDQVVKVAPLVRAEYELSRHAIRVLSTLEVEGMTG